MRTINCNIFNAEMDVIKSPISPHKRVRTRDGIEKWNVSCSGLSDCLCPHGLLPSRLLCPWDSPGQHTGVGCHSLLQGISSTQGSKLGLPHCRQILYHLSQRGGRGFSKVLGVHWKDWSWSWKFNTLATWCEELTHLKRPWCWERLKAGGEGDDRGWDGWMASPTQWA